MAKSFNFPKCYLNLILLVLLIPVIGLANNNLCFHSTAEEYNVPTPTDGGINEVIPFEFQARYTKWKDEFLTTEFGKKMWATFESKKDFVLTIKIEGSGKKGAGTGDYKWNQEGEIVGATIFLGGKMDKGFPNPIYYPVMNSIEEYYSKREITGIMVAATKIAHEFGHIKLTVESNQNKIKLENKLMPIYNSIFLKNGYNTKDQRLVELADQMGGTPTQIWENREYWGEASALNFILEKTNDKNFHCSLLSKINENINSYAKGYEERFNQISQLENKTTCKN